MIAPKPVLSQLGRALQTVADQKKHIAGLTRRAVEAERQRDVAQQEAEQRAERAERQVRSLAAELTAARHQIAELKSRP
jgi:folylpolyglutamate synthase/dihydropteroate synthase